MAVVFTRPKASQDVDSDERTRGIPDVGALALIIDGHDPAIIAAAFDTTAASVKRVVSLLMEDLLKRCTWEDLLTTRELIEVLEVRAYFRAMQNSVVRKGESHDVQTHSRA